MTNVNLAATSPVYKGTRSIAFSLTSAWGALYLRNDAPTTFTSSTRVRFAMRATQTRQQYSVALVDGSGRVIGSLALAGNGGDPIAGVWKAYDLPASAFGAVGRQVNGIWFQDNAGAAQPTAYVDAISFDEGSPPPPPSGSDLTVYGDQLASGWSDWSWGSTVNLSATSPVRTGARSIAFTVNSAWSGLSLHADTPVDGRQFAALRFAMQASQAGQDYDVELRNTSGQPTGRVHLADYGGNPAPGSWKVYSIPLADLSASGISITGIVIKDGAGHAEPAAYVDDIAFTGTGSGAAVTAAPAPARRGAATGAPVAALPARDDEAAAGAPEV